MVCLVDTVYSRKKKYKQLIRLYSKKYSFSFFDPHVTLFGGVDIEPGSTFSFFEECVKGQDRIRLDTLEVISGDPPGSRFIFSSS
ncbi:hypothetical protein Ct9H90mP29_19550 [bacterium]|nr:MAG: hypothetical protein Ct9H90mP29_19550 [bacterium]